MSKAIAKAIDIGINGLLEPSATRIRIPSWRLFDRTLYNVSPIDMLYQKAWPPERAWRLQSGAYEHEPDGQAV